MTMSDLMPKRVHVDEVYKLDCNLCWTDILFGFIALMLKHNRMSHLIVQLRQSLS